VLEIAQHLIRACDPLVELDQDALGQLVRPHSARSGDRPKQFP
jgi:hypothetical protein